MELKYDPRKDARHLRNLMRSLLVVHQGQVVSGMSMRIYCTQNYGIHIDHHEWAYLLDELYTNGSAEHYAYNGGDTQYKIL